MLMEYSEFLTLTSTVFTANDIDPHALTEERGRRYYEFLTELLRVNEQMNLTAIRDMRECIWKHLADSLTISGLIPEGAKVLDVGCGGGFPSIPLAIARPDLTVFAMDSTGKKTDFVDRAARGAGIERLTVVCARAEEAAQAELRESFDVVVSRAVARMNLLAELTLPFVRPGGCLIAMKGEQGEIEASEASEGILKLGGRIETIKPMRLAGLPEGIAEDRCVVVVRKEAKTPPRYPRTWAQMKKNPL